jgi:hypothetical protein
LVQHPNAESLSKTSLSTYKCVPHIAYRVQTGVPCCSLAPQSV